MSDIKHTIFPYMLFLIGLTISCNTSLEEDVIEEHLTGARVEIDSIGLNLSTPFLLDSLAISWDIVGNNYYGGYLNRSSYSTEEVLFKIGHGHNEFHDIAFGEDINNSLLLLDSNGNGLNSMTVISNATHIDSIKNISNWKKYRLEDLPSFRHASYGLVSLTDSTILVPGAPFDAINGHIFSIIDYKNQKVTPLESWPEDHVKENADSLPKHSFYTNNSYIHSNGKGSYLYHLVNNQYAFIFTIEGEKINISKMLYSSIPSYQSDKAKLNYRTEKEIPEKLMCVSNSENVYAILLDSDRNGQKLEEWVNPYIYGNTIEIFDWEGNKKKVIHLDKYGQNIRVSKDNKTLFLFTEDYFEENSKPEIWVYDLNRKK